MKDGTLIASAYADYTIQEPRPGWAELDATEVWEKVQQVISRVVAGCETDSVQALSVSSLGEAVVPVSADRRILGPSVLNFDVRGEEYLPQIGAGLSPETLYRITGLTLANTLGLPKLLWIREHQPRLYEQTHRFLPWSSFVSFMLGADPVVDYSLASRLLCFDIDAGHWSREMLDRVGFDVDKLPATAPTGTAIGTASDAVAAKLGLPGGVAVMAGCHDQCANAVGSGAIDEGPAACGMGTYFCITPSFRTRRRPELMIERGLNTEHHAAAPDRAGSTDRLRPPSESAP